MRSQQGKGAEAGTGGFHPVEGRTQRLNPRRWFSGGEECRVCGLSEILRSETVRATDGRQSISLGAVQYAGESTASTMLPTSEGDVGTTCVMRLLCQVP